MGDMNPTLLEKELEAKALAYAKSNKKAIARDLTSTEIYPGENRPVSVFMAGSPGAGKTEASIFLIKLITEAAKAMGASNANIIRIDPDELRSLFDGYDGTNAHLFQGAISVLVDRIHDLVLKQRQSFVLDGTFSNYEKSFNNVNRSLNKGRLVQILYVYQEPLQAWRFVQAREKAEGRRILLENFIQQYFEARSVVNRIKKEFGRDVYVDLLLKNIDGSDQVYKDNVDIIDNHIPEKYSKEQIEQMLNEHQSK